MEKSVLNQRKMWRAVVGLISDFFISDAKTARESKEGPKVDQNDLVQWKGITELEVGYLYQIATQQPVGYDKDIGFQLVDTFDDNHIIVTKIPDTISELLAQATDAQLEDWGAKWVELPELGWERKDGLDLLSKLRHLADRARSRKLSLYLWNCI